MCKKQLRHAAQHLALYNSLKKNEKLNNNMDMSGGDYLPPIIENDSKKQLHRAA
jgi:hypothetical protein